MKNQKKSAEIKIELDDVSSRLDELLETRREVEGELKSLQDAYIKRKKTIEQVEPTQSKLLILDSSIKSLESTKNSLRFGFELAQTSEKRAETIATAKSIAVKCADSYAEYISCRQEIDEFLAGAGARMLDAITRFVNSQLELKNMLSPDRIPYSELDLSKEKTDLVAGTARAMPPALEFGDAVQLVENRIAMRRQSEARAAVASK